VTFVGEDARIFFVPGAGCPRYTNAPPQIEGLSVFEEDLYAMSVEENTFQLSHWKTNFLGMQDFDFS